MNAALVFAFVAWLANRFRDVTVRLHEDGELVRSAAFLVRGRTLVSDIMRLGFKSHDTKDFIDGLIGAAVQAKIASNFKTESIYDYRERPEIAALDVSDTVLRVSSVPAFVWRLPVPWFDTNASAT
ncbi:MAG: hypothetical protein ACHREM_09580 [Polyangiales bacterium]